MSDALIIAIIGQVATILVVLIQQIFHNKELKAQRKAEKERIYYNHKLEAYRKMVKILQYEKILQNIEKGNRYLDYIFTDCLIYASEQIIDKFYEFETVYFKVYDMYNQNIEDKIKTKYYKKLGFIASEILTMVKEELKNFN